MISYFLPFSHHSCSYKFWKLLVILIAKNFDYGIFPLHSTHFMFILTQENHFNQRQVYIALPESFLSNQILNYVTIWIFEKLSWLKMSNFHKSTTSSSCMCFSQYPAKDVPDKPTTLRRWIQHGVLKIDPHICILACTRCLFHQFCKL